MILKQYTTYKLTLLACSLCLVGAWLFGAGCSESRTPSGLPPAHPGEWMDSESPNFHGAFVNVDGTASCAHCHGIDGPGGKVDVSCTDCHRGGGAGCTLCHGGLVRSDGAPPYGLEGEVNGTALAVGAHTRHLSGGIIAAAVACSTCHIVPPVTNDSAHLDLSRLAGEPLDSVAEIVWHGFADGGGATWDRSAATCSNTYCHGNFDGGADTNGPTWTSPNQALCGSCHDAGDNPSELGWKHEYHVGSAGLACGECHASVVDTLDNITGLELHVNGSIDTLTRDADVCAVCHGSGTGACTDCHGGLDNQTGAPPDGLDGEVTSAALAVGAHTMHLDGGDISDGIPCDECHDVPSSVLQSGHLGSDSIAEMSWGNLAGVLSTWNRGSATCSDTYCHGNFNGGDGTNAPVWTSSGQAQCGSCHNIGTIPITLSGAHKKHLADEGLGCYQCHDNTVSSGYQILGKDLHVNGSAEVAFSSGHGTYSGGSCSSTECHGTKSWLDDD